MKRVDPNLTAHEADAVQMNRAFDHSKNRLLLMLKL